MFGFKHTKKLVLFTLSFLLLGVGCSESLSSLNPFGLSAQDRLNKMRQNIAEVDSVQFDSDITVKELEQDEKTKKSLSKLFGGEDKIPEELDIELSGQTQVDKFSKPKYKLSANLGTSDSDQKIRLKFKETEDNRYMKINSLGPLQSSPIVSMFGSMFVGEWLEVPRDEEDEEEAEDIEITKRESKQVRNLIKKTKFFELRKDLGKEILNGREVYHYQVDPNIENINDFQHRRRSIIDSEGKEDASNIEVLTNKRVDLWIGKDDNMLYQFKIEDVDIPNDEGGGSVGKMDMVMSFSNFNQEVDLEEPDDAKTIKELFKGKAAQGSLPFGKNQASSLKGVGQKSEVLENMFE